MFWHFLCHLIMIDLGGKSKTYFVRFTYMYVLAFLMPFDYDRSRRKENAMADLMIEKHVLCQVYIYCGSVGMS